MALMIWNSRYSVGIEALDNQHKALLSLLNEFHAASMKGKAQEVAGALMLQIVSLAQEHFSAEQRLMESTKYPRTADHCARHQELSAQLAAFVARHENGDTMVYTQLLYFMRDWLSKHMQTEDRDYAPWLASHGVR